MIQRLRESSCRAFTLLEVVVVITLIVVIAAFSVGRTSSIMIWKQKGDIRRLVDTIELLANEAVIRKHSYLLILDLESNQYYVRREVQSAGSTKVDYLKNLRLRSEQERLEKKEEEEALSLGEEFREEDLRQNEPLEKMFFEFVFHDPQAAHRLAVPTEFPELGTKRGFTDGLELTDVEVDKQKIDEGKVYLRFGPGGDGTFAVIHFLANDEFFSVSLNPATGKVKTAQGELSFERAFQSFKP